MPLPLGERCRTVCIRVGQGPWYRVKGLWATAASSAECSLDFVPGYGVDGGDMRTKQVAAQAGVNTETLRYYERRGLLPEPPRTAGGYRDYPASAVRVLQFVQRSQALGFSLQEVEDLLQLADGGPDNCEAAQELAVAHIGDLDHRLGELQRMRSALVELADGCTRPRRDRYCPLLDAIQTDEPLMGVPR